MGSARCYSLDPTTIDELTTLRRLYSDDESLVDKKLVQLYHLPSTDHKRKRNDNDESGSSGRKKPTTNTDNHRTAESNRNEQNDQNDPNDPNDQSDKNVVTAHNNENVQNAEQTSFSVGPSGLRAPTNPYEYTEWVLGPNATGNDAIQRFAPLLQSTDVIKLLS